MKITDLSVIMVNWNSGPWSTATASFGGTRQLGVVTVFTDEGVEGYAFDPPALIASARGGVGRLEWGSGVRRGRGPTPTRGR